MYLLISFYFIFFPLFICKERREKPRREWAANRHRTVMCKRGLLSRAHLLITIFFSPVVVFVVLIYIKARTKFH